jgi:hypothetical protein
MLVSHGDFLSPLIGGIALQPSWPLLKKEQLNVALLLNH